MLSPLDILQETIIKRCCLGCNKLIFLPPKDNLRKYTDQLVPASSNNHTNNGNKTSKADIIIPSEHIDGVREIVLGHHFAKLTQFKSVYFISRTKKTKTTQLLYTLFSSAFKSWPLFVIALILAVCAGIIIWLSVSSCNFFFCFVFFVCFFFTSYPSSLLLSLLSPKHPPFSFFFLSFFTHLPLSSFLLPSSSSTPFISHPFSSSFSFSSYFIFLFYPLFLFFQTVIPITNICVLFFLQKQDMWKNKEQFPRGFPQGPFEGFWWAYVSMTTVG